MHIIDINLIGVMYSFKLAVHYFRRCALDARRDRCIIFGGSIAGFADNLVSQYACVLVNRSDSVIQGQLGVFHFEIWSERTHENCQKAVAPSRYQSGLYCANVSIPCRSLSATTLHSMMDRTDLLSKDMCARSSNLQRSTRPFEPRA